MNPDHQFNHQPRERSIPITTTQGNATTTHFPLSSTTSYPGSTSGPFANSPGRSTGGNLFDKLNQFRKNHHSDEMFSDHFSPFGSMSSGSRNVGDFFSHGHKDEKETESQESHQPRVYNIPIQVETPEGVVPLARSNSHSPSLSQFRSNNSYHAVPSHGGGPIPERTGESFTRQRPGPSPTPPPKPRFTPSYKPESQGYTHQPYHTDAHPQTHQHHRVHTIPVQIEKGFKPSESVSNQNDFRPNVPLHHGSSDRESPRPDSQQSGGGPHVINIPVNNEKSQPSENKSQLPPQPSPNQPKAASEPQKGPVDPLDLIKGIKDEACRLESEVNKFDGESQKQYRYLDEMLTRCMLKLDNIDSGGRDEVRSTRKSTLAYVDRVIAILESKMNRPNANEGQEVTCETAESHVQQSSEEPPANSMEAETGEADSTHQIESADQNTAETIEEEGETEQTGENDNQMEVESGSGQSKETIADDQSDEIQDEDVADGDGEAIEEEEEEDQGVDGSSKDFYNCSNNQLSNENICRTSEADITEEMDKEEFPEEPPTKINRSSEHDEKVNIELNPMGQDEFQGDVGVENVNSNEPKIELPPDDDWDSNNNNNNHTNNNGHDDDLMGSNESLNTLKPSKVSIVMESDGSNASGDFVNIQPHVEMPDESSVSSKDSDEIRESVQIVESSSPPKPVHA